MIGDIVGNALIVGNISKLSVCTPKAETYAGKMCPVIERNENGDCLIIAPNGIAGMADIRLCDVALFVPMVKKSGGPQSNFIVPANLSYIESLNWLAMCHEFSEVYNPDVIWFAGKNDRPPAYSDFREIYKACSEPNSEISTLWGYMKTHEAELRKMAKDFTS